MQPDAHAQIDVAAPADRVYALVSDLPGLATLSEEFQRGSWLGGVTEAKVGARFRGANRRGVRWWSTVSTVTDAEPTRFAFDVRSLGLPVSRWQYDIEPTATGCRVTESTWDRRPAWYRPITILATGVSDRSTQNQRNIERTLARLKQAAEA
ncbi:SRPBCC family protein [Actinokineospora iranica]|uniref:Polyketide cyclase / dehydrase and lipid transport n=1 Tax=Actinokineospora iranica TaxID=1271860 RepID=A0A1G6Q238_9PSEU|nr:SRPBCC family protein [Actinokineospora iranica]SDC86522.1 Polyketide cyclase / dehydrase and lipid transport [Actinokineospora iranica]